MKQKTKKLPKLKMQEKDIKEYCERALANKDNDDVVKDAAYALAHLVIQSNNTNHTLAVYSNLKDIDAVYQEYYKIIEKVFNTQKQLDLTEVEIIHKCIEKQYLSNNTANLFNNILEQDLENAISNSQDYTCNQKIRFYINTQNLSALVQQEIYKTLIANNSFNLIELIAQKANEKEIAQDNINKQDLYKCAVRYFIADNKANTKTLESIIKTFYDLQSVSTVMKDYLISIYCKEKHLVKYLKLFSNYDNKDMITTLKSIIFTEHGGYNSDTIRSLVDEEVIDINAKLEDKDTVITLSTLAIKNRDIKLIQYLISKGHDIWLAKHPTSNEYTNKTQDKIVALPFTVDDLNNEDVQKFIQTLTDYLECHTRQLLVNELNKNIPAADSSSKSLDNTLLNEKDSITSIAKDELSKTIDQYQTILNTITVYNKNDKKKEEASFDTLLLKYYNSGSDEDKNALNKFLQDPKNEYQLLGYYTDLVETTNDALSIMEMNAKLLHKFYQSKKTINQDTETSDTIPGLCKIQSSTRYDIFCGINKALEESLDNLGQFYDLLQSRAKFIAESSLGKSGIKRHENYIKLKIAHHDTSLYTQKEIIDDQKQLIYYIFDQVGDHKKKVTGELITIRLKNSDESTKYMIDLFTPHDSPYESSELNQMSYIEEDIVQQELSGAQAIELSDII